MNNKIKKLSILIFSITTSFTIQSSKGNRSPPNKYVQSSPPCIAAVCKNGVSLIALHTNIQTNPYIDDDDDDDDDDEKTFPDLPIESRNPLRIERIDDRGSVLVTCGWRTDGMALADAARELCRDEVMRFGKRELEKHAYCDNHSNGHYYGRWLGWALVKHLIRTEVRENVRSLSTIGLLATSNQKNGGDLHLIDTTGISKCRAYAIGKHSSQLNERLMKENFNHLTVEEGTQLLLSILQECSTGESTSDYNTDINDVNEPWNLPSQTFAEILIVDSLCSKVKRLRQPLI